MPSSASFIFQPFHALHENVCDDVQFFPSLTTDEKPSNMELRQKCIATMQAAEYAVEHSVSVSD